MLLACKGQEGTFSWWSRTDQLLWTLDSKYPFVNSLSLRYYFNTVVAIIASGLALIIMLRNKTNTNTQYFIDLGRFTHPVSVKEV